MMQAAMPSENRLVAIKLLLLMSLLIKVSEHNSTATSKTTASGLALAAVHALAKPEAPPAQPSPNTGVRFTCGLSFILLMIRASRLGVANPVDETKMRSVISFLSRPEDLRQSSMA